MCGILRVYSCVYAGFLSTFSGRQQAESEYQNMQARIGKLGLAFSPTRAHTPVRTHMCTGTHARVLDKPCAYALACNRDPLSMLEC